MTMQIFAKTHARLIPAVVVLLASAAFGQAAPRNASIGYLYPAGAQQGAVVKILAGGQGLRGVTDAHISGDTRGVRATVIQFFRPLRNLDKDQRAELTRRFNAARERRLAEARGETPAAAPAAESSTVTIPPHPYLQEIDNLSLRELDHVKAVFMNVAKRQPNAQIGEMVLIEITVDADAAPGVRQLRLITPAGITNPMPFEIGLLPEAREYEPNDPQAKTEQAPSPPLDLPICLNGQIMPGDVDRFPIRAREGQRLVIATQARCLSPYLADAVPGWFQATVALYDSEGREVAFADDYRFDPDPVIFYDVPADGEYVVEVRDSIFRGREDFVYRIAVGELPFITSAFPLGGPEGSATVAAVAGYNLPSNELRLDTTPGAGAFRTAALDTKRAHSNSVAYAVDTLPESLEIEPNNTPDAAQPLELPCIVNGRIGDTGDTDVFQFQAPAGGDFVAEVIARRLSSPLDSLIRLYAPDGCLVEWNDDYDQKNVGLLTHHADSYLRARLSESGVYRLELTDAQQQGGEAFAYRLRLGACRPDFELRATPSALSMLPGATEPLTLHVVRKDGFDGDIELVLKDAPQGFKISGGRIPAGLDRVRITVTAPAKPAERLTALKIEGRARIDGETVTHEAIPADDLMQAFAYRHLVPADDLLVAVSNKRPVPPVRLAGILPARIPVGGAATVRVKTPPGPRLEQVRLQLNDPPKGIAIGDVAVVAEGLEFSVKAEPSMKPGYADNLIVEAYLEPPADAAQKQKNAGPARFGALPAIPFEIVEK